MGQLKYGANTIANLNAIEGMELNDECYTHESQTRYKYDGSTWVAQTPGEDIVGQYYDILHWVGTWDSVYHLGDVTARVTCRDAVNHIWDQIVFVDTIFDGEIVTDHIQDGAVTPIKLSVAYAPLASPALTGTPTAPTVAISENNAKIATTAAVYSALQSKADSSSIPTNISQLANDEGYVKSSDVSGFATESWVTTELTNYATISTLGSYVTTSSLNTTLGSYAPKASPAFTGTPTAPTATAGTNTGQLATTAFVTDAITTVEANASSIAKRNPWIFNGTDTAFTIPAEFVSVDFVVFINGIVLTPTDDYTVSSSTITFINAYATGSNSLIMKVTLV
jgi:hypothetical protein